MRGQRKFYGGGIYFSDRQGLLPVRERLIKAPLLSTSRCMPLMTKLTLSQSTWHPNTPRYWKSLTEHSVYPYMRIRLSAPVELENLLPYDFKYRIYDKNTKKDWTNFLRKGGLSPVHVVELSHLLLMSIDMQDTPFKPSEFAIINSNNQEDFRKESILVCKDAEGLSKPSSTLLQDTRQWRCI